MTGLQNELTLQRLKVLVDGYRVTGVTGSHPVYSMFYVIAGTLCASLFEIFQARIKKRDYKASP